MVSDLDRIQFIRLCAKKWKTIISIFSLTFILTAAITLILPKWYRSYITILPPNDTDSMGGLSSLMGDLPLKALGFNAGTESADLVLAVLKSRTILESTIKHFNLIQRYNKKNIEEAIKELLTHYSASENEERTITLFAEASTPFFTFFSDDSETKLLAQEMAKYFIVELDRINRSLKSERAKNTRIFIEKRYHQNLEDLKIAEDSLKVFQQKYGVYLLPEQTSITIQTAMELKAEVISKEVQRDVLNSLYGSGNSEYLQLDKEIQKLKGKLVQFESASGDNISSSRLMLPFNQIPDLSLEYIRLYRDVTLQEKILEFILPQYEQAKIQEAKDTPSIQILDDANYPIKKHHPKRAIIVIFYSFLSIMCCMMYFYLKPSVIRLSQLLKEQ